MDDRDYAGGERRSTEMSKADWGKYAWMRDYWWAIYLVMAVLFVIFSFRIIGDLGRGWTESEQNRREIEEGHQKAEVLKKKLAVLGAAPEEELRQNLARLILAVPASKQLFAAGAELKLAATVAGVKLDKYSALTLGHLESRPEPKVLSMNKFFTHSKKAI